MPVYGRREPALFRSLYPTEECRYFGAAGVLPHSRRRGVQLALIQKRLHDAAVLGCSLVIGGNNPGTTAFRNFERAGLHLIPAASVWRE